MLLGDLGARVIKVEQPVVGDVTRGWGPPEDAATGLSPYFLSINRNKESIALDLASPEGRGGVATLARRADVLVENFAPGVLDRWGVSLERLRAENPRLVTASITAFGREGPDAAAPGFDLLAQAGAGLMAITGTREGGGTKVGVAASDLFAGCFAAVGILAALTGRERTGRGGHVETDLFSATLAVLINVAQAALQSGREPERHGNAHPHIVPYRVFRAADEEFVLAVGTDRQFARLAVLLGRPEWAEAEAYRTNAARVANRQSLEREIEAALAARPRAEWLERCRAAGLPAGPVRGALEALESETARALRSVVEAAGHRFVAPPVRIEGHRPPLRFPPRLDEDGARLREEFGLPD